MLWYALNEVSVLDVETGETDFVTKVFDRNTYMPKWSENGEKLYFILEDNMKSQLVEYSFTDKTFEKNYSRKYLFELVLKQLLCRW